jgi:uncharacterized protein
MLSLEALYGGRIERIMPFGSRARGDRRPDSDYDIALFLRDFADPWADIDRITGCELDILDNMSAFIHTTPFPAGSWKDRTPIMSEIRREGIPL